MKLLHLVSAAFLGLSASVASAGTLDFDTTGTCGGGLGVTFTMQGTTSCSLGASSPDDASDASLHLNHSDMASVRADIAGGASFVSVAMGDWNADPDNIFLEVFDAADNSLGYTDFLRPGSSYDMDVLSIAVANIAYAIFGTNSADLGFIAVDDFSYRPDVAPVPLPASALLLVAGLGALGATRRRKKS